MKSLYKTTIIIWSDYDPAKTGLELDEFAREAVGGDAYCSKMEVKRITHPERDDDWDGTEFFLDDEEESEC